MKKSKKEAIVYSFKCISTQAMLRKFMKVKLSDKYC